MLQRMTKLMEWVTVGVVGLILWISAYSGVALLNQFRTEILWSPVALLFILGVYSVLTIAYRCWNKSLFLCPNLTIFSLQGWQHSMTARMLQRSFRDRLARLGSLTNHDLWIHVWNKIFMDHFKKAYWIHWFVRNHTIMIFFREDLRNKGFDFSQ